MGEGGPLGEVPWGGIQGDDDGEGDEGLEETVYYSDERMKSIIMQKSDGDITLICINIETLPGNFNGLHTLLSLLEFEPDIIGLSETKITTKVNSYYNPHLDGYTYRQSISSTRSGSVGVFIKNTLVFNMRDDLDITVPGVFETIWFDVVHKQGGKKSTFGQVYRHHEKIDIPFFEHRLETIISKLNLTKSNFYIFGDMNINSLLYDQNPHINLL